MNRAARRRALAVARQAYPRAAEARYVAGVEKRGQALAKVGRDLLLPMLAEVRADSTRLDAKPKVDRDLAERMVDRLRAASTPKAPDPRHFVRKRGLDVAGHNGGHMRQSLPTVRAVRALRGDVGPLVDEWVRDNVKRIKTVESQHFPDLEKTIRKALADGWTTDKLTKEIAKRGDVITGYARRIARDQIGTLNEQLTDKRHRDAGIMRYEWLANLDEATRKTHAANHGRVFHVDHPPATGHPGHEIQCRCTRIPVFDDEDDDDDTMRAIEATENPGALPPILPAFDPDEYTKRLYFGRTVAETRQRQRFRNSGNRERDAVIAAINAARGEWSRMPPGATTLLEDVIGSKRLTLRTIQRRSGFDPAQMDRLVRYLRRRGYARVQGGKVWLTAKGRELVAFKGLTYTGI